MVEMAGKEYLLKLRKERLPMRKEIVRLLAENETLSFQEIYLKLEGKYHKYCPFPYERDRILEGVVKNELAVLVSQKKLEELKTEKGVGYCLAGGISRQNDVHAA